MSIILKSIKYCKEKGPKKFIIKVIARSLGTLVFLFSFFIPTKDDIWVFGSETGSASGFSDNAKYLYLYCQRETEVTAIWITQDDNVRTELNRRGYRAYKPRSLIGIYYTLISDKGILTRSIFSNDVPWYALGNSTLVQL